MKQPLTTKEYLERLRRRSILARLHGGYCVYVLIDSAGEIVFIGYEKEISEKARRFCGSRNGVVMQPLVVVSSLAEAIRIENALRVRFNMNTSSATTPLDAQAQRAYVRGVIDSAAENSRLLEK